MSTGASSLVTALTYGALAYLVIEHRIGVAEAGAAVAASQQLSGQLSSVVNNMTQLYEASLFLEDWDEFSSLAPARAPAIAEPAAPFDRIELDHVSFRYPPSASKDGGPALPSRLAPPSVSPAILARQGIAPAGGEASRETTLPHAA